jgi:hypothetical protein
MDGRARDTRLQIMLNTEELAAVDAWRFRHHMPSRAATVRQLLNIGLRAESGVASPDKKSQDFGLLSANGLDANQLPDS